MGALDPTKVHRVQGNLCVDPDDLSEVFPHGGKAIGITHYVTLLPTTRKFLLTAEEYGRETTEELYMGRDWVVSCLIRQWDNDMITTMFPNTAVGGTTGDRVIKEPGGLAPGVPLSTRAVKLCFSPIDAAQPGFIVYRALPQVEIAARFRFHLISELGFIAVFRALRDANGNTHQIGRLADLTV